MTEANDTIPAERKHKPLTGPRFKNPSPKMKVNALLRAFISAAASLPGGFRIIDAPAGTLPHQAQQTCARMIRDGNLIRSTPQRLASSYFTTQAGADAYKAAYAAAHQPKPKPEPKPSTKHRAVAREPWKPKPPTTAAKIVHTDKTIYTERITPPSRYFVEVPRQRIGTASWVDMRVAA